MKKGSILLSEYFRKAHQTKKHGFCICFALFYERIIGPNPLDWLLDGPLFSARIRDLCTRLVFCDTYMKSTKRYSFLAL